MTSRYRPRQGLCISHSRFAVISKTTVREWRIPISVLKDVRAERGTVMIDRRRLTRQIRREVESIRDDIDALEHATADK